MNRSFYLFALALTLCSTLSKAQTVLKENIDFETVIQQLLPQQELDIDYNDVYDRLFTLYLTPLNLNRATRSDLQSIFFLNEEQINGILQYREKFGDFRSIYELLTLDQFDRNTVEKIKNFVSIEHSHELSFSRAIKNPSVHELFLRYQTVLESRKGYTAPDTLSNGRISTRYVGKPGRLYARYLMAHPGNFSFGFTVEKDPGEKLIWDPETKRYGMDYYSFHAMIENQWIFNRIIVGDFNLDFGQGLVFGSGISFGKGTQPVTTTRRNNLGLRPYRSVFESKDFSGIAIESEVKGVNINIFLSNVLRDAQLYQEDDSGFEYDTFTRNISTIGLHRTPNEISSKHNVSDRSFGGNLNTKIFNKKLEIGLNGVYNTYNLTLSPDSTLYRLFQFRGRSNYNMSAYFNYYFKNAHVFSEIAMSQGGGLAHSTGLIASLSSQIQMTFLYRDFDIHYHAYTGNAFSENTILSNEKGIYWGVSLQPINKLLITGYFDYFIFPWLKYRVDAPSAGWDYMASMQYEPNSSTVLRLQYRQKSKSVNYNIDNEPLPLIKDKKTSRLRFELNYHIDSHFSIRSHVQSNKVNYVGDAQNGFLIAQEVSYNYRKFTLSGRFSIFDADAYDSRLYIYERDLLYLYSVPSFYNKGVRYYILGRWEIDKKMTIWLKYSKTIYHNVDIIGTGLDEIQGNKKTNVGLQMRIKF